MSRFMRPPRSVAGLGGVLYGAIMAKEDVKGILLVIGVCVVALVCVYFIHISPHNAPVADIARCEALYQVEFTAVVKDWEKDGTHPRCYRVTGRGSNRTKTFGYVSYWYGRWNFGTHHLDTYGHWEHSFHCRTLDECLDRMHVQ